jgi:hypothetical protein
MKLVNTYKGMLDELADAFENRYRRKDVNITGILFARPQTDFARKEILPHMDFWHHRSDNFTDFFCPGYFSQQFYDDAQTVLTVGGKPWFFSNHALTEFLKELERHTTWHYSGGCELLVTNARYKEEPINQIQTRMKASLDLSSAIAVDLEKAHHDKAFRDVTGLADAVFEFAKNLNESTDDPCWEFSDKQGVRIVKGSLKEFLVAYLPSWLKPEVKKAFHFVTTNISKSVA